MNNINPILGYAANNALTFNSELNNLITVFEKHIETEKSDFVKMDLNKSMKTISDLLVKLAQYLFEKPKIYNLEYFEFEIILELNVHIKVLLEYLENKCNVSKINKRVLFSSLNKLKKNYRSLLKQELA